MSVNILEALQGADYNLQNKTPIGLEMARSQVHNVTVLLEKGYDIYDNITELVDKYNPIEDAPEPPDEQ